MNGKATDSSSERLKCDVRAFWEGGSCGETYAYGATGQAGFDAQAAARYRFEPFILDFAKFAEGVGRAVLEVGVGMGADHQLWAESKPRYLAGVDLTLRAVGLTRERLLARSLPFLLLNGDAERLPFASESFDIVYSWGVLHHSPNTPAAIEEVRRVLKPGGVARIMIYHKYSIVGFMLWVRYALFRGRLGQSLSDIYAKHLESPGTKAYSTAEAWKLFSGYSKVQTRIELSVGDLMEGVAGQRHQGRLLSIARTLWPRKLIRSTLKHCGLFLLIEAKK